MSETDNKKTVIKAEAVIKKHGNKPKPPKGKPVIPKRTPAKPHENDKHEQAEPKGIKPASCSDDSVEVVVKEYEYVIEGDKTLVPIPKKYASYLAASLHEVPTIANNINNYKTLGNTAYSITLEGKDVLPEQLFKKNNGSLISNLKGESSAWGKQTDVNPIDYTKTQALNLGNAVFSVAAVATSTYYLKNINDNLNDLKRAVDNVFDFLNENQKAQIKSDLEDLEDIMHNLEGYINNDVYRNVAIQKLTDINRTSSGLIRSYESGIINTLERYKEGNQKKKKAEYVKLQENFYYYTLCLKCFTLSEMLIAQIADSFGESNLKRIEKRIKSRRGKYRKIYDQISETVGDVPLSIGVVIPAVAGLIVEENLPKESEITKKVTGYADAKMEEHVDKGIRLKKGILYCDKKAMDPAIDAIEKARCLNAEKVMLVVSEEGDYYIQTDQDYIE